MQTVKVSKGKLQEIVKKNRDAHRATFEKALRGYQAAVVEELEKQLGRARNGLKKTLSVTFHCPEDHTSDYDRIIRMLDLSLDDSIELSQQEFSWYVQDDWGWKQQWTTSNIAYVGRAQDE